MAWFKVDDQSTFHPKVIRAGNAAFGAWVRLGAYCNAQLTDGFVPEQVARMIASKRELDSMLNANMIHEESGGYGIHDYLKYQPSREQVEAERKATRERVSRHRNGVTPPFHQPERNGGRTPAPSRPDPVPTRPLSENTFPDSADAASGSSAGVQEGFRLESPAESASPLDFEAAYKLFPRKEGKSKGLKRAESKIRTTAQYERFVAAIGNYATHVAGREVDKIKHFDTFVGCWEDYAPGNFVAPPASAGRDLTRGQVPVSRGLDYSNGGPK